MRIVPTSALRNLKDTKKAEERNKYRVLPRRSPRKHQTSIVADQARQRLHSDIVFLHHRGVLFRFSLSGYPIIKTRANFGTELYPWLGDDIRTAEHTLADDIQTAQLRVAQLGAIRLAHADCGDDSEGGSDDSSAYTPTDWV